MRVFISHSSRDVAVAESLVELLRSALNLPNEAIRCTSVEGFRLPGGVPTDETLRREVHDADLFLALITPNSLSSAYVVFELGARWGAGKVLIPLLATGATSEHLKGPLQGINALDCSIPEQIHQLIDDASRHLSVQPSSPTGYQKTLEALIAASTEGRTPAETAQPAERESDTYSNDRASVIRILANDAHVDDDREITIHRLKELLGFGLLRLRSILEELEASGLAVQTRNKSWAKLTPEGERLAVQQELA